MSVETQRTAPLVLFCWHGDLHNDKGGGNTIAIDRLQYLITSGYQVHLLSRTPLDSDLAKSCHRAWFFNESLYRSLRRYIWRGLTDTQSGRMFLSIALRQAARFHKMFLGEKHRFCEAKSAYDEMKRNGPVKSFQKRRNALMLAGAEQLIRILRPDIVMASFAWNAVIFDKCAASTLKVLDTHDIQNRRAEVASAAGGDLMDRDCSEVEESEELRKADLLIGIQAREADVLRQMCPEADVVEAGHAPKVTQSDTAPRQANLLLYVANLYDPNVLGLKQFLKDDWPALHAAGWSMRVIGNVCNAFSQSVPGVTMLGRVESLDGHYEEAAVVLNLAAYGTGLPVKVVEAVGAGRIVLAREESSDCFAEDYPILRFRSGESLRVLAPLMNDQSVLRAAARRAVSYANEHLGSEQIYAELTAKFQERGLWPRAIDHVAAQDRLSGVGAQDK